MLLQLLMSHHRLASPWPLWLCDLRVSQGSSGLTFTGSSLGVLCWVGFFVYTMNQGIGFY